MMSWRPHWLLSLQWDIYSFSKHWTSHSDFGFPREEIISISLITSTPVEKSL